MKVLQPNNKITQLIFGVVIILSLSQICVAQLPNIILINADDLGYGDLGCYGSPNIFTPNLDKMATEGMRFTSFYAAAVCGPSRAQLMTGSYHARVSHSMNELPGAKTGLHPNEITVAEVLKSAGYKTMHIGKWHLGDAPEFMPTQQGFDQFWGFPYSHDMWPYHSRSVWETVEDTVLMRQMRERAERVGYTVGGRWKFPPLPLIEGDGVIEKDPDITMLTMRFTEKALEFIEENKNEPFFLYLAHVMPHTPLAASDKFKGKSDRGLYGDAVMEIDWSCGEILQKLKALGIDENTLVVFTSDNGPTMRYGSDGGSAGLLRGGKGTMFEGGMRVPAIFRWPEGIPSGMCSNEMASNIDILPTFAHLVGAKIPDDRLIDGESLLPLLKAENENSPHEYIHYFGRSRPDSTATYRAIRNNKWKLFVKHSTVGEFHPLELYNLGTDPSEKYDRLDRHPKIADKLLKEAQQFYNELEENKRPIGKTRKN
ncbi:MAG: sulfatase [Cytophagales bacterium]|nr:sulfatase [Cytophagales bacterium]